MKFIAYCIKGLEDVSNNELKQMFPNASSIKVSDRKIFFELETDFELLKNLRTIDDIAIFIDDLPTNSIKTLDDLWDSLNKVDFNNTWNVINSFRELDQTFSITLSMWKFDNFTRDNAKDFLGQKIAEKYKKEFTLKSHNNFDIRINIEKGNLLLGVRVFKEPLYEREYKKYFKEGSLKPNIAAALIRIGTEGKNGLKVVDNFCGSGTILCEAFALGNEVYGSDIDAESVEFTKKNLKELAFKASDNIIEQNADQTSFQNQFFDVAISNLPWNDQVKVESFLDLYGKAMNEYQRIMKPNGTLCLLIKKPNILISKVLKVFPKAKVTSRNISFEGQRPTIVLIKL